MSRKGTLYVICGPNGSGKTTIIESLLNSGYLPDVYISPDILVKEAEFQHIRNEKERYSKAMDAAEALRYAYLAKGKSFCFETVMSTVSKLEFIKEAKEVYGFKIELLFIGTTNPEINIRRVAKRVRDKGHDVPTDKIVSRYIKCYTNLETAISYADTYRLLDNSGNTFIEVVTKELGRPATILENPGGSWDSVIKYIQK